MTASGWLQIVMYGLVVLAITKPLGIHLYRVFENQNRSLLRGFVLLERWTFRLCGISPEREQNWKEYALALLVFSLAGVLVTYGLLRIQPFLPFNPQNLGAVPPDLAFNTAVSFVTNTNWQAYSGEATMSYFSQKGRNRDTAWYAIIDKDWPKTRAAYEEWLAPGNFDGNGKPKQRLSAMMKAALG